MLKNVNFFWRTIVSKVMKAISYLLLSEYLAIYSSMKIECNRVIVKENSYD